MHSSPGRMNSWTLVTGSVLIIAFEVPLVLRNLRITARIIGIGAGGHFFMSANTWFTDATGTLTWSLDRQARFGRVSERLHAPLNAIPRDGRPDARVRRIGDTLCIDPGSEANAGSCAAI